MERLIYNKFIEWKKSESRKPLLIQGAKLVGKTYSMLKFGKNYYEDVAYFNFGGYNSLPLLFEKDLDPERLILELSEYIKQEINKESTLIIFDNIQACEKAVEALKYFQEDAPEYHIMAAGCPQGLALNRKKCLLPEENLDIITMFPLNFEEFLMANNKNELIPVVREHFEKNSLVPRYHHLTLTELYKTYLIVGGYPSAVKTWLAEKDYNAVRAIQGNIADACISDIAKYSLPNEAARSVAVLRVLPSVLSKQNIKFQYAAIKKAARANDYELSMSWLKTVNAVLESHKVTDGVFPLEEQACPDYFKIYYSDVGLLSFKLGLSPQEIMTSTQASDRCLNLLAENYVAQQLTFNHHPLYYWESNGIAEVEFVVEIDGTIVPIECKEADNFHSHCLRNFIKRYSSEYSIRANLFNFRFDNNIKSIPLYALFCV